MQLGPTLTETLLVAKHRFLNLSGIKDMLLSSDHGLVPSSKKVKSQITHITQNFTHLIFWSLYPRGDCQYSQDTRAADSRLLAVGFLCVIVCMCGALSSNKLNTLSV